VCICGYKGFHEKNNIDIRGFLFFRGCFPGERAGEEAGGGGAVLPG